MQWAGFVWFGVSWNQVELAQGPYPHRLPLQHLAPHTLPATCNTEYLAMFKYREVPKLLGFFPVRMKSGFGCWIINW